MEHSVEAGEVHAEQTAVRWDTPSLAESGKSLGGGSLSQVLKNRRSQPCRAAQGGPGRRWGVLAATVRGAPGTVFALPTYIALYTQGPHGIRICRDDCGYTLASPKRVGV